MQLSHGVEPEIDFSPGKPRRYEQYSSELCSLTKVKVQIALGGELLKVYVVRNSL